MLPTNRGHRLTIRIWGTITLCLTAAPATGQSASESVAAGDSVNPFLHPDQSLVYYQRALALDSTSFEALWRVGRAQVDIGKQILDDSKTSRHTRDSLYSLGRAYAERAIQVDSSRADGHFVLALALGRLSLTRGGRERVKFGGIIYNEAARALAIDPDHDGAQHILGHWHAEVKRLSGATRFVAKLLFGGGFLGHASWDSATVHMVRAVELNPGYIYHRLVLAEVYRDMDRNADAVVQLEAIATLPDGDVLDPEHRRRAIELLGRIRRSNDD